MVLFTDLKSCTFPALLQNSIARFGDCGALSMADGSPLTYKELGALVLKAEKLLYGLGVRKGSKIAILSGSMPQWGAAYFGIVNRGAAALPLLPDFNKEEIRSILEHAGSDGMFVSASLYEKVRGLPASLLPFIIAVEDFQTLRSPSNLPAGFAENGGTEDLPAADVSEEDTASIIYTSGTTGRSKGVELSHRNLVWMAVQCQTVHRVHKMDRCLSFLPLSHVYEFTIGFVMQILNGSCVYYLGKTPAVSSLLPAMAKVRPTIILSVPLVIEKIYKYKILPAFSRSPFIAAIYRTPAGRRILHRLAGRSLRKTFGGRIRFFGIGGAKISIEAERFMKEARFPYATGYGLTETSPLLAGSSPGKTVLGTVGPVLKGVELKVLDPDPKTGIGEIAVKGPNVMKGYYRDEKLTAGVFTAEENSCGKGWFKTGDLGILEKRKGRPWLTLKGRSKNVILGASGENIYPEDIEFILNQHPLVQESLVVEDGDGLVALVQLDEEKLGKRTASDVSGYGGAAPHNVIDSVVGTVGNAAEAAIQEILYKKEEILSEIRFFINSKVNRISRIGKVRAIQSFEKTASQKIKRYLYNLKRHDGNDGKQPR